MSIRITVRELAQRLNLEYQGDGDLLLTGVAGIRDAGPQDLTFLGSPRYEADLATTRAGAIILKEPRNSVRIPVLIAAEPYLAFQSALGIFAGDRLGVAPGIHPTALIGSSVQLGRDVCVGPFVWIGDNAVIGDGTAILAGCYVGRDVRIGRDGLLYPRVVVREGVILGERVIVHAGAVIGDDGFGFVRDGGTIRKVPQIGTVEIGDDVEVGANATIDRATTGVTRIQAGTKIDNLVQVAHNVQIGRNSILCAQVGVSGSTVLGESVTLAGQAGLVGHIRIGDGAMVGAQGGVTKSVPDGESVSGYPALPHAQARRIYAAMRHLPDLLRTVRDLARRIAELEEKTASMEEKSR